jgi:hypothetical protein
VPITIPTLIAAAALGLVASTVMSWASNRSALWKCPADLLGAAVLAAVFVIACLLTWVEYSH